MKAMSIFFLLFVFGILFTNYSCSENSGEKVPVVNAKDINMELASELPEPSVAWQRKTPDANGDYCCVCQTLSGQTSIRLAGVGPNFDVCVGCEIACRNAGHQGADGSRSKGGKCD